MRVAIGVCTARRPEMLRCCLAALAAQVVPDGCEVTLIVADNEPEPNNRHTVEEFGAEYIHEPRPGISRARNAILSACRNRFDWIAFTDDDCRPEPTWLAEMLAAAERHNADVVRGRHIWLPPEPTPFWYAPPDPPKYFEGQHLDHAGGGNVIFVGWLASLRFDESLAHGEDTDFFYRATRQGARIVYSCRPVIYETSPPHRGTLRYQVMRAFYFAASRANFERRHKRWGKSAARLLLRFLWQVPIAIIRLLTAPLVLPFSRQLFKRNVLKGLSRLMTAVGTVAGLAGHIGNPYT